jgi:hypothetical protein
MKKHVLIGSVLLAAISAFSQSGKLRPQHSALINTKMLANAKFQSQESAAPLATSAAPSVSTANASKTSVLNNWNNFTSSMNIYGSVIAFSKPLQWNDELNAVSYIHRKSPSYNANGTTANTASGAIVAMISTNCGASWDSTLVYADATNRGRYPQGGIYNPPTVPTNTNINNAYVVACGPVTLGSGWVGNFYASKELSAANFDNTASSAINAQQYYSSTGPYTANLGRHDFSAYGFTATDDGKMRSMAGVTDDALTADTAVMMVTGTFNNGVFDWAGTVFNPPTTIDATDGSKNFVSRPMMAWNEAGTHGYVVIIGSRLGSTGSNVGFQPIVYKTTNSGSTWSLENGINFNSPAFNDVKRSIITVDSDSTLEVPNFTWIESMDCAVDANNKLHVFSTIYGHASNHPDSLGYYQPFGTEGYKWPHQPGFRPYLYDFIYDGVSSWSHITVDSMSTEGPAGVSTGNGYQDNPWDMDPAASNQKVRIDARLQMSRTPDGKYLVYTWAESDTTVTTQQKKWNSLPNVKARLYNTTTGLVHPQEINVTGTANGISGLPSNGNVANRAMYHFTSPKCRVASTSTVNGPALTIPMTVSNSNPYSQLTANSHWFSWAVLNFGNIPDCEITLCGAALTTTCVSINENELNITTSSYVFPNPTKNNATLNINLENTAKVKIEVMNTVGQVVKSTFVNGQVGVNNINIELSGLASGIYLVNVKVDNASSTKKLIIE